MQKFILTPLRDAVATLDRALAVSVEGMTDFQRELHRDALIQRFEYTYELAFKFLKRYLQVTSPSLATIDELGFHDLLRLGAETGLIKDVKKWFDFRDKRNITSHCYDEKKAREVRAIIPKFLQEVQFLLAELKARTSGV